MSAITIKDIPPSIHKTLKSRARQHGRSLNKEIIMTLQSALHSAPVDVADISLQAKSVRESMGVYLTQVDIDALKQSGRK